MQDLVTSGVNLQLLGYFAILNTTLHFLVISLGYFFTFPRGHLSVVRCFTLLWTFQMTAWCAFLPPVCLFLTSQSAVNIQ